MTEIGIIFKHSFKKGLVNAGKIMYLFMGLIFLSLFLKPSGFDDLGYLQFVILTIIIFELLNIYYSFSMTPIYNEFDFNLLRFLNTKSYLYLVSIFLILNALLLIVLLVYFAPDSVLEFAHFPRPRDNLNLIISNLFILSYDFCFLVIFTKILTMMLKDESK